MREIDSTTMPSAGNSHRSGRSVCQTHQPAAVTFIDDIRLSRRCRSARELDSAGRCMNAVARYMLVANQTIHSPQLRDAALRLQADDQHAELTLVVPATRVVRGLTWDEIETKAAAQTRLEAGGEALGGGGCPAVGGVG